MLSWFTFLLMLLFLGSLVTLPALRNAFAAETSGVSKKEKASLRDLYGAYDEQEKATARLEKRIDELCSETVSPEAITERVAVEVAVFADRCDIEEELVRLRSHIDKFHEIIAEEEVVGRKIDFLIQEMNREVNTIGSKTPDAASSGVVVEMKSELEKIREQVQNIE